MARCNKNDWHQYYVPSEFYWAIKRRTILLRIWAESRRQYGGNLKIILKFKMARNMFRITHSALALIHLREQVTGKWGRGRRHDGSDYLCVWHAAATKSQCLQREEDNKDGKSKSENVKTGRKELEEKGRSIRAPGNTWRAGSHWSNTACGRRHVIPQMFMLIHFIFHFILFFILSLTTMISSTRNGHVLSHSRRFRQDKSVTSTDDIINFCAQKMYPSQAKFANLWYR